jgi:antitoxin component YwqK of YwqJK toxin-antitoxin module
MTEARSIDDLVKRDGLYYEKFTDEPFTGKLDEGWARGAIKNGEREGPWVTDPHHGDHATQGEYKNGKRDGPWVEHYEGGQLRVEVEYKNGKMEGPWVRHHFNGRVEFKGAYKNGEREGPWVFHDYQGVEDERSGTYRNGRKISD